MAISRPRLATERDFFSFLTSLTPPEGDFLDDKRAWHCTTHKANEPLETFISGFCNFFSPTSAVIGGTRDRITRRLVKIDIPKQVRRANAIDDISGCSTDTSGSTVDVDELPLSP